MEGQPDLSILSAEQADTNRLIEQLLGTAVAYRYVDFCRLASGTLPLIVSRPLAGHALRELDSLVRHVLATPMEARASDNIEEAKRRSEARAKLKEMGFDDLALQRAERALKPAFSHKKQIQQIATRLSLSTDGDIAKLWIKLNEAYGRVHERSFHLSLEVDESFRSEYVRPFDAVIRALMVQLQGRYAALMQRAKKIASMPPAQGIRLFINEIPGALQLQAYFYDNLQSATWLPHLASQGLLAEPLPDLNGGSVLRLWSWPVGRYLARMASSDDAGTRGQVVQAVRALASSAHPDVHRLGMDVIEALPSAEGTTLVDVLERWISPTTDLFTAAPQKVIAKWAASGDVAAAIRIARSVFALFERDGEVAAHFDATMYQHYLEQAVKVFSNAQPLEVLPELCILLMESSRIDKRLSQMDEADYSYYTVDSFEPEATHGHDFLGALVIAVVRVAAAAVRANHADINAVLQTLTPYRAKIFVRMRLYLLALAPSSAPDLATAYLTDARLIDADWCREEYALLARLWFPHLAPAEQTRIFEYIDAIPEGHSEAFHAWFEQQEKRKAEPLDERRYRETTVREVVWLWRSALPPDRLAAIEKTVTEFGDPDAWREVYFRQAQSPLSRAAMLEQSVDKTAAFLLTWQPDVSRQNETAGALANELREAASAKPDLFSADAVRFAPLRPLFVRYFFDGLRQTTQQNVSVDWQKCLTLAHAVLERSKKDAPAHVPAPGDDPDWSWTLKAMSDWLSATLSRGTEGITFAHHATVRALVLAIADRVNSLPEPSEEELSRSSHPYFSAQQTLFGSMVELSIIFLFWSSKDAANAIGKAPREALVHDDELRSILDATLARSGTAGRAGRSILGRYLSWLFYFGESWLRERLLSLFPKADDVLRKAAWVAHIQSDQQPVPDLTDCLGELYSEHIAVVGGMDDAFGGNDSRNRLVDYLVLLYLWEKLPEPLLQEFWRTVPPSLLRHAMWFAGRHLTSNNALHERARTYWDRRLELAKAASDKNPFKKELGVIGVWFMWDVDADWLLKQLMLLLNAGFAPNDGFGVIGKLAEHVPARIDDVVEIVRALVRHPDVETWIFGTQEEALRKILSEGKASSSSLTVASVKEIISYLSSRGNSALLDLDDEFNAG
ncbi:MAG: hypothetical protein Q8M26_05800 [Pseudolabrys sp.]|nr:hypothetical protein [Pseudolabrys sp.]